MNMMKYSPTRRQEYMIIKDMLLKGKTLDIGGGRKADYMRILNYDGDIISINIDKSLDPTVLGDAQKKFPFRSGSFDNVISLNVLEHIYDYRNVFSESFRTMKKGGKFYMFTPFLYKVHGSPNDYWRYTESTIVNALKDAGFRGIKVKALGHGMFTSIYCLLYGPLPRVLRPLAGSALIGIDRILKRASKAYRKECSETMYPLGYFTEARK